MVYNLRSCAFRRELLDNKDAEAGYGGEPSEDEEDHVSVMSEGSEYEISDDDMEVDDTENAAQNERILESRARGSSVSVLRGNKELVWNTKQPTRRSDRAIEPEHVIIPGPKGEALNCNEIWEFWELLFNQEILQIIVEHTNMKIEEMSLEMIAKNQELQSYHHHTDVKEVNAFLGILYYSGLWKSNKVRTDELWSKKNGITFYRCVMPNMRFKFLSVCLRFDDRNTRQRQDRLSPIRNVWEIFINNCRRYYEPHNCCTVGEQLLGFRGRCIFRTYMKAKPDKYGLKIITLNDARTSYLINGIPYLGKTQNAGNEPISEYFCREVTTPIHGTNRSVTCDNWFISIPLMEHMLEPPYLMKVTGMIRKNKREILAEMKVADKEPPATKFCFTNDILLLSHTPKKNKIVLLASTHLRTTELTEGKPEVILHYNRTKGGTDCFDQLCHSYTTSRATLSWPLRFFFGMLDQAIVNSRILHKCHSTNRGKENEALTAKECLHKLSFHLVAPYLRDRYELPALPGDVRKGIGAILGVDHSVQRDDRRDHLDKRVRCGLCPGKNDRKTKQQCPSCSRPMCDSHRVYLCVECGEIK